VEPAAAVAAGHARVEGVRPPQRVGRGGGGRLRAAGPPRAAAARDGPRLGRLPQVLEVLPLDVFAALAGDRARPRRLRALGEARPRLKHRTLLQVAGRVPGRAEAEPG